MTKTTKFETRAEATVRKAKANGSTKSELMERFDFLIDTCFGDEDAKTEWTTLKNQCDYLWVTSRVIAC